MSTMSARLPPAPPTSIPVAGMLVGERYRVVKLLDEGAMGRVFLGEHVHMRKAVAIKVLRRELTRVPEVLARFEREALAAAHIEHPNVAAATDFGKLSDGSVYLILEYVEGRTLRSVLNEGPLSEARALHIAGQIASALAAAHALDIVHRDLKPENVMLVQRGSDPDFVKVLDFGVAKVPVEIAAGGMTAVDTGKDTGETITKAGMVFGTPDYMAPEQALGQSVDARADLYSLGVILFEMLSGKRPFVGGKELGVLGQQLAGKLPALAEKCPQVQVSSSVEQIVRLLLVNEASARLGPAAAVAEALAEEYRREQGGPRSALNASEALAQSRREAERARRLRAVTPKGLWKLLDAVPLWGLIAVPVVLLGGIAGLLVGLDGPEVNQPAPDESAPKVVASDARAPLPGEARASASAIREAQKAGALALDALAARFPRDGAVRAAQARLQQKAGKERLALDTLTDALTTDPGAVGSPHMKSALWFMTQGAEAEAGFALLSSDKTGAIGPDIALDLATTAGVPPATARRARAWLDSPEFVKRATAATQLGAALVVASGCRERRRVLSAQPLPKDDRLERVINALVTSTQCPQGCLSCVDAGVLEQAR